MSSIGDRDPLALKYRKRPCRECPWKTESRLGKFPPEAFRYTADTTVQADLSQWDGRGPVQKLFACHMSGDDEQGAMACAGFLAADGPNNIEVRLRVFRGQIPTEALAPGEDWPELYDSHEDMARANGLEAGDEPCGATGSYPERARLDYRREG